ncbi:MAG: hypothetical protein AVDCRST_MAG41-3082, partial [uncultured Corynebacteriales bacterium]
VHRTASRLPRRDLRQGASPARRVPAGRARRLHDPLVRGGEQPGHRRAARDVRRGRPRRGPGDAGPFHRRPRRVPPLRRDHLHRLPGHALHRDRRAVHRAGRQQPLGAVARHRHPHRPHPGLAAGEPGPPDRGHRQEVRPRGLRHLPVLRGKDLHLVDRLRQPADVGAARAAAGGV